MKIVFLVLAHNEPESIIDTARFVTSHGHNIIVHYDASARESELRKIQDAFDKLEGRAKVFSEIECAWGKWSLVEAPLKCLDKITELGWEADYVHLMSAAEHFSKPITHLEKFLSENSTFDFIESVDITEKSWVQGGLEIERFQYYFPYSFVDQKRKFDCATSIQRLLGIEREIPKGIRPRMGSQWWTLRWSTCEKIIGFLKDNQRIVDYFRTTWIPDESFFQTITAHLIPENEIAQAQIVFHWLTPNGRPFVFKNGHEELVAGLPHFLIRKVSPHSTGLLDTLKTYRSKNEPSFQTPPLQDLRKSTRDSRKKLKSWCDFVHSSQWEVENIPFEHLTKFFVMIIHSESQMPDVLKFCEELADTVEYLKQPFSENEDLRPKNLTDIGGDSEFTDRKLIALLTSKDCRLPVASFLIGADTIPDGCQLLKSKRSVNVLLKGDSKLVDLVNTHTLMSKHMVSIVEMGLDEIANELKLLKIELDRLNPNFSQ